MKKQYIKPNVKAHTITPTLILAGSGNTNQQSFSYGGGNEWPWYDARAKGTDFFEGDDME